MTKIIRLEPHSMAVFWKTDCDPGFAMELCSDASLFSAVHRAMFVGEPDEDTLAQAVDIVQKLRDGRDVGFEDGWISLRIGMAEVTSFLLEFLLEVKKEERWSDQQRFEELKGRQAAEAKYALLQQALIEALGDRGPDLVGRAAA